MSRADMVPLVAKVEWAKLEVSIATLIECGVTAVSSNLTGVSLNM